MHKRFFLLLLFLSLVCCHSRKNKLIPANKLVKILVEMHTADALALDNEVNINFGPIDSATIYGSVMKKNGITREQLEQTIKYYSSKPEKLNKIYDQVFSTLSSRAEEYQKTYDRITNFSAITVWRAHVPIIVRGDTAMYPGHYDVPIDSMGTYVLSARILLNEDDSSISPRFTAYFYNPDDDRPSKRKYFKTMPMPKSRLQREYNLVEKCDNPDYTKLRILLPEYNNTDQNFNKDMTINYLELRIHKEEPKRVNKKKKKKR